ncbi:hypothetical protein [Enterobacter ludwigii]|uniref:hypothetical protein n=1 Tax=Enterobacter ludwigii TaxID=299767 RepID=UPI000642D2B8|nr:hypothetical protein [Enterobacter ludwigii]KLP35548.1 hypothetical protein ABR36_18500 [Enterobacter ludwigii]
MNKFRQWLSIEESARYLTGEIKSPLHPQDVYRLALDGHLNLSLYFPSVVYGRRVRMVQRSMHSLAGLLDNFTTENRGVYLGLSFEPDRLIDYAEPEDTALSFIKGIQDIPLLGDERLVAETFFCQFSQLPLPRRSGDTPRGLLLNMGDKGLYQVQRFLQVQTEMDAMRREAEASGVADALIRPFLSEFEALRQITPWHKEAWRRYVPAVSLPPDAYFVVRMEVLDDLVRRALSKETEVRPTTRTVNGQAQLIKSLLALHYGEEVARNPRRHFDGKRGKIRMALEAMGLPCPGGQTVARWLEDAE